MRRLKRIPPVTAVLILACGLSARAQEKVHFGAFGTVTLYRNSPTPANVVLFISGDGGWNLGVVGMARALASMDALVAGIDVTRYLRTMETSRASCSYPASDFEALGQFIQKHCGYSDYTPPVLAGYSSGATLAYAVLAQAPPAAFRGALSLGFGPDLDVRRGFCEGGGLHERPGPGGKGVLFLPAATLETPWIVLQGLTDKVCDPDSTARFVRLTRNAEMVALPKVGHGFSVENRWMPQFRDAFRRILASPPAAPAATETGGLGDLPLIEVPAKGGSSDVLAVQVTGDGGWSYIDRGLGTALAERGVPVVALNALQYFWKRKSPERASADLARVLNVYLAKWGKKEAVCIGYSLGAEVLPFMVDRLPPAALSRVRSVVLLGPGDRVNFEFHISEWFAKEDSLASLPVIPEIEKLRGRRVLCLYGSEDRDAICTRLPAGLAVVVPLRGGHRMRLDYKQLVDPILQGCR
jgi:type IV secretory pathway VirJ component